MFRTALFTLCSTLLSAGTAPSLFAQVDVNKMLQDAMQQGGQGKAQIEDDTDPFVPNAFVGSFRMEMHNYKEDAELKNSPIDLHYWSSKTMTLVQTTGASIKQDVRMLTDLEGKWQYMLMTDAKGKRTAMKSHKKKIKMDEDLARNVPDVQVTAETKTIDGYLCHMVISKSEEGVWTGWVTKDVQAPFADMMRQVQQPGQNDHSEVLTGSYGMPLEYEWVDAEGKERIVCKIRDLKVGEVDEKVFSLDGYEVMEMPSFGK
ncbi:MAG TPA: DUF4412 domain-containing protein [Flavobacteriales bacterium]|nr:DUF4412 domain-containing protein [Flavobacteriales bacterium]